MGTARNSRKKKEKTALRVIRSNVAGIDLGSREHWVCCPGEEEKKPKVKTFRTTTPDLTRLADWLESEDIESVAMESTGVYWIPLYELLEARGMEVVLVNARQLSNVPGRKTDMLDCQWLQLLHSCGLLRGSFRPNEAICKIRTLQRERANMSGEASRAVQRMQKALDQMNIQVHRAVSNLVGKTGLSIVEAIVRGERDPIRLAAFRDKRCKKSEDQIAEYLTGTWREEHLFNLKIGLRLYGEIQEIIAAYDQEILRLLNKVQNPNAIGKDLPTNPKSTKERSIKRLGEEPLRQALWNFSGCDLTLIDGIGTLTAQVILTEAGPDLESFPSEKHFVSWLRLSPKTSFSAGRPLPKKNKGTGATRIAGVLRMAAVSLQHSPSALGAYYRKIARTKGASTAVFATARKLAVYVYRMIRFGQDYVDEGAQAYELRLRQRRLASMQNSAKQMGYQLIAIPDLNQVSG